MNLSCTVTEINCDFSRKSQIFHTAVYFTPLPAEGVLIWIGYRRCGSEN